MEACQEYDGWRIFVLNKTNLSQCFHKLGNSPYITFLKLIFMTGWHGNA
jgi:hypothetical protein